MESAQTTAPSCRILVYRRRARSFRSRQRQMQAKCLRHRRVALRKSAQFWHEVWEPEDLKPRTLRGTILAEGYQPNARGRSQRCSTPARWPRSVAHLPPPKSNRRSSSRHRVDRARAAGALRPVHCLEHITQTGTPTPHCSHSGRSRSTRPRNRHLGSGWSADYRVARNALAGYARVKLLQRDGPHQGANMRFTFEILP